MLCLNRSVICSVDGCEWIVISGRNAFHLRNVVFAVGEDEYKMWSYFVLFLIQCGVATSVTSTYHTTNTSNKLPSHQFTCNVPCNKTCKNFPFFLQFLCTHQYSLFCIGMIQTSNSVESQCLPLYMFLSYFIIKIHIYETRIINA